jgi:muramoyltetrapeptide carboxypeptidase LdcA involved in peptidoglycan recycling
MVNLPYGHGKDRMTLPVGAPVTVAFDTRPSLNIAIKTAVV